MYLGGERHNASYRMMIIKNAKPPVLHPRKSQGIKQIMSAFIVTLTKSLREMTQLPKTCDDLTWKFLKVLSSGYKRVYNCQGLLPGIFTKVSQTKDTRNLKQSNHAVKQVENAAKFWRFLEK